MATSRTEVPLEQRRDGGQGAELMAREVREGLARRPRWLPSKYFYDDRGSVLFEEITRLPEYYQTRTEEALLEAVAGGVVDTLRPCELAELGSGAGRKIRTVLDAVTGAGIDARCVMLDINESFVRASTRTLAAEYPDVDFRAVVGDFTRDLPFLGRPDRRLILFFAGTIGNLRPEIVPGFLSRVRDALDDDGGFLVGLDLVKDVATLEAAYNDSAGVTAAFNLNMLANLNRTLGADFDLGAFEHVAFFDHQRSWIEMRLRSLRAQHVHIPACDLTVRLEPGEEIRTEISCKYTRDSFAALLGGTGLRLAEWYTDDDDLFALALARP